MKFLALFLSLATGCHAAIIHADRVIFPSAPAAVTNAPSPFPANSFLGFVVTGQSLANGSGSGMNLSTTPNPTCYTQGGGAPVPFGDNPVTAGLSPCTESYYQTETITTSSMQEARALGVQQSMGSLVAAASGQPYYGWLDPGSAVWILNQEWISNCVTYATNPAVIFPAWFVVHGEANASDTSYTNALLDWCKSATTNCQTITGQTNIVKIFSSQISSFGSSRVGIQSDLCMLTVSQVAGHSNITVCPKYMLPSDQTDSPHLQAIGYQRLGEYYGKAFHDEFYSNSFSPLIITNATRNGATITASFGGCIGGLSIDTNTVPFISNYGIAVDGYTVTNVAITNGNQIFIQLSTATSGSCVISCALDAVGTSGWSGNGGGSTLLPDYQARSNLRDNDPRVGFLSGSNLWNWPVHHQFIVP